MPKYRVRISRKYIHEATIEIEAKDEREADRIAYKTMGNYPMHMKEIDNDGDYVEVEAEI
jgi:hypothetical protein